MRATKLSRSASHRRSLVKNLATSVLLYETVQTTPAKARAVQSHAERLITTAKRWRVASSTGTKLALYRSLLADTADRLAAKKLIEVLARRFADRAGGYTRRVRLAPRLGDGAEQVVLRLTETEPATKGERKTPLRSASGGASEGQATAPKKGSR